MTKLETLSAASRGDGALGRAADDEPMFVRRRTIMCPHCQGIPYTPGDRDYCISCSGLGHYAGADMLDWKAEHGSKVPD